MKNDIQTLRDEGIKAIKKGQKIKGRALLKEYLKLNPKDTMGWLWLSSVVESHQDKVKCLKKVLSIDPNNKHAQIGLERIDAKNVAPLDTSKIQGQQENQRKKFPVFTVSLLSFLGIIICVLAIYSMSFLDDYLGLNQFAQKSTYTPFVQKPTYTPRNSTGRFELFPVRVDIGDAYNGWRIVDVTVGFYNGSNNLYTVEEHKIPRDAKLITAEGYLYDAKFEMDNSPRGVRRRVPLPFGFRYWTIYYEEYQESNFIEYYYRGEIAETTRLTELKIPGFGNFDLDSLSEIQYPVDDDYDNYYDQLPIINENNDVIVTIEKLEKVSCDSYCIKAYVLYENLHQGYERAHPTFFMHAINGDGMFGDFSASGIGTGGTLNPGQRVEQSMNVQLPKNSQNIYIYTSGDIEAVIPFGD
jgi:hypothetical protein